MEFLLPATQCREDEKLKMRRWIVTNILDSERAYLSTLDILLQVFYASETEYSQCRTHTAFCCVYTRESARPEKLVNNIYLKNQ